MFPKRYKSQALSQSDMCRSSPQNIYIVFKCVFLETDIFRLAVARKWFRRSSLKILCIVPGLSLLTI